MPDNVRYWLRASLAGSPRQATKDKNHRSLYRASLQQFEELLDAAAATGYASRPLPLFYALSQAGRAIVACRGGDPSRSHGLTVVDTDVRSDELLETLVSPRSSGWFQAVADATRSNGLEEPVAIGALVASLPDLSSALLRDAKWQRALYVEILDPLPFSQDGAVWLRSGLAISRGEATNPDRVRDLLTSYPRVSSRYRLSEPSPGGRGQLERVNTAGGESIVLLIRSDDFPGRPVSEVLDRVAPQYRWVGRHWLRPGFGAAEPPSALMTWWLLLFGLSMLARYHPETWVKALDRDLAATATELERAMDVAVEAIPHLVLEAIRGEPVLLPPFAEVPPLTL